MGLGERDRDPALGVDLSRTRQRALIDRAGVRVGVFSIDLEDPEYAQPQPAAAALKREADSLRTDGAQLIVGLIHGGIMRARDALAPAGSGVDIALASHTGMMLEQPERVGGTWLVEAGSQGKQVGQLDLHIVNNNLQFKDTGRRGQIEAQLGTNEQAMLDMARRRDEATDAKLRDFYERQRQVLADQVAAARRQLAVIPVAARGSWLEHKTIPLGTEIADDPSMTELIAKYKDDVAKMPLPSQFAGAPVNVAAGFTGGQGCKTCHAAAYAQWETTKHARAFASLEKKNQSRDPACIGCHVTGGELAHKNVQCEACHGPGAAHAATNGAKMAIVRNPPEPLCRTCHTATQSVEWEWAAFRSAILGKGHGRH